MFKILTLNKISDTGTKNFPGKLYDVKSSEVDPDAILVRSQSLHEYPIPNSLKMVGRAGAGVNTIPVEKLTKLGIPVLNTPGANANAVRELVIAGMLLASRHICEAWNYTKTLDPTNEELHKEIEQHKRQFVGFELLGKTLGVIGLGSVGVKVANAAVQLGMHVIGYDPTISVNRAWELSSNVQQAHHLTELLHKSDFVSLHVPLMENTKHLMNATNFQAMKTGAILLNFSREEIVEQVALIEALNNKKISYFVTDFPSANIIQHPHVINLPHLGASTKEAEENCAVMIVKQTRDFLEKGSIINSVNFPTVEMPDVTSETRIAIVNENIPSMVAQISAKLAEANLNIASLLNKSRDAIAYTVVDVNDDVGPNVLKEIAKIKGVIQVRKLQKLVT